ncbi:bifunctional diguanylate cyclase/phosphodiesterase [Acetobacterium woodii]|uniref:Putative signaling protein n=1 Tax=Acetobacterium woodii (strain ATCC 29683 / DSM 1030 / JCM 2381 / KCTC 1655 / WB1) TaxID=931626 RepID=H6LFR1_ACEWD|nr:EAL domain-containing protein [Acetobacterium woodii]AFA47006.1 putative signaling protein [Acetobacterium woodii DSM 1030]
MKTRSNKIKMSFIAVATVILFFLLSWCYVSLINRVLSEQTFLYLSEVGSRGADLVESKVNNELENLITISKLVEAQGNFDQNAMMNMIRLQAADGNYKRMGIALPTGEVLTSDGLVYNIKQRTYFQEAIKGQAVVSDSIADLSDGEEINVYAAPIFRNNEVVALVLASVKTDDLKKYLEVDSFSNQGYSYIVKANGEAVVASAHPNSLGDFDNVFDELKDAKLIDGDSLKTVSQKMAKRESGSYTSFYGELERHTIYEPLAINDWYLMTVVPTRVVSVQTTQITSYSFALIGAALLAIALLFIIILIFQNRSKRRLERIAYVDEITNGNNWQKFKLEAAEILELKNQGNCALLTFDIDRFRFINEEYGNEKGDEVLRMVVDILKVRMGKRESYARVSGDHFAILCSCEDRNKITFRIKDFIRILNIEREAIGIKERLSCHFGIYIIEDKTGNLENIREKANMARIAAKTAENESWFFYSDTFRKKIGDEKAILDEMEDALEHHEFEMFLQPKYNLHQNQYCGCEALVRWRHPQKELIFPGDFIPIFEQTGFIKKLDMFMIEEACKLLKRWEDKQYPEMTISVNVSRKNLKQTCFIPNVLKITNKYQIKRHCLEIELTESSIFEDVERMIEVGKSFRSYGFKVSMDDFGSGYSSINLLGTLPLDVIKIDQGFFKHNLQNRQNYIVVEAMIDLIKKLGMTVVAEGIETIEEVETLRALDCDIIQGYYFGKPETVDDVEKKIFKN